MGSRLFKAHGYIEEDLLREGRRTGVLGRQPILFLISKHKDKLQMRTQSAETTGRVTNTQRWEESDHK